MAQVLQLPRELTIYTVGESRTAWLAWMGEALASPEAGPVLAADAAAVDQVDAAGVQLLLSLANALAAHGRSLRLTQPSEPVVQACRLLGTTALLEETMSEAVA